MTGATLAIAVLGLVLSIVSLTWQAATFVLSGSRVRADLKHGARNADVVVSGPPGWKRVAAQGLDEEVIGIEVRNVDRMAASIDSVHAALPPGNEDNPAPGHDWPAPTAPTGASERRFLVPDDGRSASEKRGPPTVILTLPAGCGATVGFWYRAVNSWRGSLLVSVMTRPPRGRSIAVGFVVVLVREQELFG